MNLQEDPLGDQLTTCPKQMGWEISIELYLNWWFECIENLDGQFCNGSVPTGTWARTGGQQMWLTPGLLLYSESWIWPRMDPGIESMIPPNMKHLQSQQLPSKNWPRQFRQLPPKQRLVWLQRRQSIPSRGTPKSLISLLLPAAIVAVLTMKLRIKNVWATS